MWCRPVPSSVSPMYIPGRLRTASRPLRTWMLSSLYVSAELTAVVTPPPGTSPGAGTPGVVIANGRSREPKQTDSSGYKPERFQLPSMVYADCKENMRRPLGFGDEAPGANKKIATSGQRWNDLALGDRDQRLAVELRDDVEEQPAAHGIELARHVVEQQDRGITQAFVDVSQLRELERQHEGSELALRGMAAGERSREPYLQIVDLRTEAREAPTNIERPAPSQTAFKSPLHRGFICCGFDVWVAAVGERHGQGTVQRSEIIRKARFERGDQRAPAHHHA